MNQSLLLTHSLSPPSLPLTTSFCYLSSSSVNLRFSPSSDFSSFCSWIHQHSSWGYAWQTYFVYFPRPVYLKLQQASPEELVRTQFLSVAFHPSNSDLKVFIGTQECAFSVRSQKMLVLWGQGPPFKNHYSGLGLPMLN